MQSHSKRCRRPLVLWAWRSASSTCGRRRSSSRPLPLLFAKGCRDCTSVRAHCLRQPHAGHGDSRAGGAARGLRFPRVRDGRRPDLLCGEPAGHLAADCRSRGQNPQGRQPRRSADRAADAVRAGGQPQDREVDGADHPRAVPAAGRRGDRMKRRTFITLLGGTVAWPLAANAQQTGKVVRLGFLGASLNAPATAGLFQQFLDELRDSGFSEGQNLIVEHRRVDDPRGTFVAAAELMRAQVDLIVAQGPEVALQAVVGASRSIPIVLQAINYDPIERGYVASLARPGGNITGLFFRQAELAAKKVELLAQAFPERTRLGILWDALTADEFSAAERAAKSLNLELRALKLETAPYDFAAAFQAIAQGGAQILLVLSSPFFAEHRRQLAELAIQHRLPSMFIFKSYVEAGGLMAYGVDQAA